MRKRILFVVLSLLLVVSGFSGNVFAAEFPDMPVEGYWSTEALEKAVENELLNGFEDGTIKPKENLDRAQMAAVINRAFGAKEEAELDSFKDVQKDDWFYTDMAKAVAMGTFQGDAGRLNPNNPISREEAFAVIARALDAEGSVAKPEGFTDLKEVSTWATEEVYVLVNGGYVEGSAGKLNPKGYISREEFAQLMHNIIADYKLEDGQELDGNAMINKADTVLKDATIKGDLVIGDGVAEGDVTLDNVTVEGRLLVRGGGVDSILIKGKSNINIITTSKVKGAVRISVDSEASAGNLTVRGDDVIVEGKFKDISIVSENIEVNANKASADTVSVSGESSKLVVGEGSTIKKLVLKGAKTETDVAGKVTDFVVDKTAETPKINVKKGGQVDKMEVNTEATIAGEGKVIEVKANANNIKVNTVGTKVAAAEGTTGVKAGNKEVEAGGDVETEAPKEEAIPPPDEEREGLVVNSLTAVKKGSRLLINADFFNAAEEDRAKVEIIDTDITRDKVEIINGELEEIILDISSLEPNDYTIKVSVGKISDTLGFTVEFDDKDDVYEKLKIKSIININETEVIIKLSKEPSSEVVAENFEILINEEIISLENIEEESTDSTEYICILTIDTLKGREGKLVVNGIEKNFDFKAPEVQSIDVRGTDTVEITFNERLDPSIENINIDNFGVHKGMHSYGVITASIDETRTKVTLKLIENSLTVSEYRLRLGIKDQSIKVRDISKNGIYGGTEIIFKPSVEELEKTTAPEIITSQYDDSNGVLDIRFNKPVTRLEATKLSINNIRLTSSDLVKGFESKSNIDSVAIKLSNKSKKSIDKLTEELTLRVDKDAFTDGIDTTGVVSKSITKTIPPIALGATYDVSKGSFVVKFDQKVRIADPAKIMISDRSGRKVANGVAIRVDGIYENIGRDLYRQLPTDTWEIVIPDNQKRELEKDSIKKRNLKVFLDRGAIVSTVNNELIRNAKSIYEMGIKVDYITFNTK